MSFFEGLKSLQAAVVEKIVVLGYLVRRLEQRGWSATTVVVIAVLVRVSYHLYYGPGVLPIVLWALATVLVYRWLRRLLPFIVCHFVWDAGIAIGDWSHAAAVAFDRAVAAVGEQPSEKQRADLAGYLAELEIGRGELEAGVIDALSAIRLARDPKDRFSWKLDLANGLVALAESCEYRPLVDTKTSEDGNDVYGACRRAVAAGRAVYEQAGSTAAALGWTASVDMVRESERGLDLRGKLIEFYAARHKRSFGEMFHPRSSRDVLTMPAARYFRAMVGGGLNNMPTLAPLIETVVAEEKAKTGRQTALGVSLLGTASDIQNAPPEAAAQYYKAAAAMLEAERSSFFDPRRRGTVIEGNANIIVDLAIRLLALGREADAFAAFDPRSPAQPTPAAISRCAPARERWAPIRGSRSSTRLMCSRAFASWPRCSSHCSSPFPRSCCFAGSRGAHSFSAPGPSSRWRRAVRSPPEP